MNNRVIFYIRRTRQYFLTRKVESGTNKVISDHVVKNVRRCESFWATVTGKSFAQIRSEISDVAYDHNLSCKPDIVYNYSDKAIPADNDLWVLPVDEDDLIDHQSLKIIREYHGPRDFLVWRTIIAGHRFVYPSQPGRVLSNSYALKSEIATRNDLLVHKHKQFRLRKLDYAESFPIPTGLKIETPASAGRLWEIKDAEMLRELVERFKSLSVEDHAPHLVEPFIRIQSVFTLR